MSDNKSPYLKGAVWFGLLFILPGAFLMLIALSADAENFDAAPRWIVFSSGLMFFNAGIVVGLMDTGFNEYRETSWLSYLHGAALISIPLILIMIINWVAFGPGEREFSIGISIPFLDLDFDRFNEIIGRIFFGIPALIFDIGLLVGLYQYIQETFGKQDIDVENDPEQIDR